MLVREISTDHPGVVDALSADKGYDSGKNRAELQEDGINTFIAVGQSEADKVRERGMYTAGDFHLDEEGRLVCPAGKRASRTRREPSLSSKP